MYGGIGWKGRGGREADGPEEDLLLWLSGLPGPTSGAGESAARGRGNFAFPLRAGETGRMEGDTLAMPSRSQKFDPALFCRTYRLKPEEFARMSQGALAKAGRLSASGFRRAASKTQKNEAIRVIRALGSLISPKKLGPWMRKPNRNFGGLTPIEVIEQGKMGKLWRMIYEIESGQPD